MQDSKKSGGYSRTARRRRDKAAILSQAMRRGDGQAALSLVQRRRALQGIAKHGWSFKVHAMNVARYQKRKQRVQAAALAAEWRRLRSQYRLTFKDLAKLRAAYGSGALSGDYGE